MKKIFKKEYLLYEVISFLFSLCLLLKYEIGFNNNFPTKFINSFHFNFLFFLKAFIISIPILLVLILLLFLLSKIKIKNKNELNNKNVFFISFIGIFITGLIFLIIYYPGNIFNDTLFILKYPYGSSSQHPLSYILFITIPFKIFNFIFHDINFSIFLTCIIQLILSTIIISSIITWINHTFKKSLLTILLMIYFIFTPIITNYNTSLVKDSLFCIIILSIIPITFSIIKSKGEYLNDKKGFIITILVFTLTSIIRNNGIYVIFVLLISLLIKYKNMRKKLLIILLTILSITTIQTILSKKQLFQEKIAIPLQQISYTVYSNGKISNNNIKYLNKIYKYDLYKKNYNPYFVDTIKWDEKFNRDYLNKNERDFIKIWLNMLPNNFESYVKAYLLATYGNWAIESFYPNQGRFLGTNEALKENSNLFNGINSNKTNNIIKNIYESTTIYFSGGICFWILLFIICYIIYKKKCELLFLTIPLLIIWLSLMLATPFSLAFRYMSPYMYSLPIILVIVFSECNDKKL